MIFVRFLLAEPIWPNGPLGDMSKQTVYIVLGVEAGESARVFASKSVRESASKSVSDCR